MGRRHLDAPRSRGGVQVWDASLLGPLHACPKPLPTARVAQGVAAVRRRPRHRPRRQSPQGPGRGGLGEPLACGRGPWLSSALLWVSSPVGLWSTSSPCSAASTVSHTELVEDGGTPEGFACTLRGVLRYLPTRPPALAALSATACLGVHVSVVLLRSSPSFPCDYLTTRKTLKRGVLLDYVVSFFHFSLYC